MQKGEGGCVLYYIDDSLSMMMVKDMSKSYAAGEPRSKHVDR